MIKVINCPRYKRVTDLSFIASDCVDVMRGSDWGNPFIMRGDWEREYSCDMFEKYAQWRREQEPHWLVPLRGKHLICCCAPKRCHAETLRRLANF